MKKFSTDTTKAMHARCLLVGTSPDTAKIPEVKVISGKITILLENREDTGVTLKSCKVLMTKSTKQVNALFDQTVKLTVRGLLMLESLKTPDDLELKKLRVTGDLNKYKVKELLDYSLIISNFMQDKKSVLIAHGYTEPQVDEIDACRVLLLKAIADQASLHARQEQLRTERSQCEEQVDHHFCKLNDIIAVNKVLIPDLYRDYHAIKVNASRRLPNSVQVKLTSGGLPVANAMVRLYGTAAPYANKVVTLKKDRQDALAGEVLVSKKLSKDKGVINIKHLKPGTYRMLVSKVGFADQEITVYVNPKEVTRITVVLKPL